MANSLYSHALEYNLGDKEKNEFIDKNKFINYLLENLGQGGHHIALQRLKDKFGGKKRMSTRSKKKADKIIRESLRGNATDKIWIGKNIEHSFPFSSSKHNSRPYLST